jgi:hypothetical protein
MNWAKRLKKRFSREHRNKAGRVEVVYRAKNHAEGTRRVNRAERLVGTPFLRLPGEPDQEAVLFHTNTSKHPVKVSDVEMVFNDAVLMDAISNWGTDGPLYKDTITGDQAEVYDYAMKAFADVPLPAQLVKPL